tara:strand:+ start:163 stop:777 length:615 start_codon:yes stop_codon:yes gene_type:complete
MSNFTITPFDISANGGYLRAPVKVKGYWSNDAITAYIQRQSAWTLEGGTEFSWKASITHSSGGRDTAEVESDLDAALNFSEAMASLALYTKEFLDANVDQLEETFLINRALAKKEYEEHAAAQKKAEEDRIAVDVQITKDAADALFASVESGKTVQLYTRGSLHGKNVSMKNWGNKSFYINHDRVSKKKVKELLVVASARSAVM